MRRRIRKPFLAAALVGASALIGASERPLHRLPVETRVVPPLADPAIVPGVTRCTSDGRCTVADESGTRRGVRITVSP
jgi:hypothetical protein